MLNLKAWGKFIGGCTDDELSNLETLIDKEKRVRLIRDDVKAGKFPSLTYEETCIGKGSMTQCIVAYCRRTNVAISIAKVCCEYAFGKAFGQ